MNKQGSKTLALAAAIALILNAGCAQADHREQERHESHAAHGYAPFEFALIGDAPYNTTDGKFENVVDEINHNRKIRFVMHAGDIKNGSSLCSDEMFQDRLARFQRFNAPFVLTPGDNEWTDCHRVNNGQFQPLERLAHLRQVFFPEPGLTLGGKPMRVESQAADPRHAEFVENVRWMHQHVMFATLHAVGSNNAVAAFDPKSTAKRGPDDDAEVARRIAASQDWIAETFAQAKAANAQGVLFLFQANPGFELPKGDPERVGFEEILAAFEREAVNFGKPVILAHGDSHYYRVDKPMLGSLSKRRMENVTRVETFGANDVHWLRVVVDPKSPEVFTIHQEIVDANLVPHPLP